MVEYLASEFKAKHKVQIHTSHAYAITGLYQTMHRTQPLCAAATRHWCFLQKDIHTSDRAMRRLLTACERVKRTLSAQMTATIEIDSLFEGIDFATSLSRAKFEDLCGSYFRETLKSVEKVLADAKVGKGDISEIVLVGGSTRIPKVQSILSAFFNGKKLNSSINPDEAVAFGAAVQGAILGGHGGSTTKDLLLIDVCPLSLGIETSGAMMSKIINRQSVVPCKKSQTFSTFADNQQSVNIQVFQGERAKTSDCIKLGSFELQGIPPAPRGVPQIEVSFDLDANSILTVSAEIKGGAGGGEKKQITIKSDQGGLTKEDIDRMVNEAAQYKEADDKALATQQAKSKLEQAVQSAKSLMTREETKSKISSDDTSALETIVRDTQSWLDGQTADTAPIDAFESKLRELEAIMHPITAKLGGNGNSDDGNTNMDDGDRTQQQQPTQSAKVEEVD
jgi:heat shock protein 1/8